MLQRESTMKTAHRQNLIAAALVCVLALTGCQSIGPHTVAMDRFDYSSAIADSWKQQTLLNIVKLRYLDLPVFVDVSSVVAGYSLQTGIGVAGMLSTGNAIQGNTLSGSGQAIYTDRPTVTYTPLTGQIFLRGLMTPIEPKNIFFMLQSGYAADFVLGLTVESLNGVRNRSATAGATGAAEPEFVRVLHLTGTRPISIAARTNRRTPLPPCITAINGSGWTTVTGARSVH